MSPVWAIVSFTRCSNRTCTEGTSVCGVVQSGVGADDTSPNRHLTQPFVEQERSRSTRRLTDASSTRPPGTTTCVHITLRCERAATPAHRLNKSIRTLSEKSPPRGGRARKNPQRSNQDTRAHRTQTPTRTKLEPGGTFPKYRRRSSLAVSAVTVRAAAAHTGFRAAAGRCGSAPLLCCRRA